MDSYFACKPADEVRPKKHLPSQRIIWQYWGQGFDNAPAIVQQCTKSVDRYASDWLVIRLDDNTLSEYLEIPDYISKKRDCFSHAFFSDVLRLMLLKVYGGLWLDSTVMLSGHVNEEYLAGDFFVFRRDPLEPDWRYWRDTYAYYFGWDKGFRVNMLSSIMYAKKGCTIVSDICGMLMLWMKDQDNIPDYFFLQILFDVYGFPKDMPIASDTLPHYLQQSYNDPAFNLMSRDEVLANISMHKLTHKIESQQI